MKKLFLVIATAVVSLCSWANQYGILVNGTTYFAAEYRGKDGNTGEFDEYLAHVKVANGDHIQLYDLEYDAAWVVDLDQYTVAGFTKGAEYYTSSVSGCYDFYIKMKYGEDQLYIGNGSDCGDGENIDDVYRGAVPRNNGGVLMQAFFNDSYSASAPGVSEVGDTKWTTLTSQASEIGRYFDYVWLPPSAYGDGAGYHPKQYSNQNSNWGTRTELDALISALHNAGSKVIADIVINHCSNVSSWCDFYEMNFGEYGVFQPDASWICNNDEVNTASDKQAEIGACYGTATGNPDDGDNWSGARDWSHDMPKVQNMFIAYLRWMREVMHYDGWRYDKGDGFNNWHHWNYNRHSKPELAFMECYSGTDEIQGRINGANGDLMGLDFDLKWHVFNSIAGWDYSRGRGDCIMSRGDGRHAVTFIDSHDWFMRPDNENEFGGRGNSLTETMKCRLLQANAFLLSMPGLPCVFYPHWAKYKDFIKPMIEARKLAGVHSESGVWDESSTATGYQATVGGKDGYLILCLGDKAHQDFSEAGYVCKASYYETNDAGMGKDASYQIWVNRTTPMPTGIERVEEAETQACKFMQDGKLFIRVDGKVYDITGKRVL
jgi:alpha-amylase